MKSKVKMHKLLPLVYVLPNIPRENNLDRIQSELYHCVIVLSCCLQVRSRWLHSQINGIKKSVSGLLLKNLRKMIYLIWHPIDSPLCITTILSKQIYLLYDIKIMIIYNNGHFFSMQVEGYVIFYAISLCDSWKFRVSKLDAVANECMLTYIHTLQWLSSFLYVWKLANIVCQINRLGGSLTLKPWLVGHASLLLLLWSHLSLLCAILKILSGTSIVSYQRTCSIVDAVYFKWKY